VPPIGRRLLGDAGYEYLKQSLKPGQQAVLIAANGLYSFKGSGYVRGGIVDLSSSGKSACRPESFFSWIRM
jgi:NosR/NirI family nitrous oxide reductase transcriptional regulator